ncbi:MAG: PorP/SprF family type IX secretion system membrane protein [Bacteroidales bacterium]|nr:PorP/SprF family type IX secretion system membrane protein [Bacteroidales bacterium]
MKKIIIAIVVIVCPVFVLAQQLPEVSYFMYDYSRTNPGSLGSEDMVCATLIHKNSWLKMPGRPTDTYVDTEVPFNLFGGKHGAGFSFLQDKYGFYNNYHLRIGYAFRFTVANGTLGIGINGGFNQYTLKANWDGAGAFNPTTDPNIPQSTGEGGAKGYAFSAGIFYRADDIYFGISVLNAYASEIDYAGAAASATSVASTASEKLRPHYYITSGYKVQLSNPAFELQPAVNLYSDGSIVTFDLNTTLMYNKKIWGGVSYRAGSSAIGMLGLMILDGLKVGYAYDFQTSALSRYSTGSHEILMNYCFKIGKDKSPQRYKSIRYL